MFGFSLTIFCPRSVPSKDIEFFNHVYRSWKQNFTGLLEKSNAKLDPDDLFRVDQLCVVHRGSDIVGMFTLTGFDLRLQSAKDHHYVQQLSEKVCDSLIDDRVPKLMAVEYLTVFPEWRKSQGNIAWLEILLGISSKSLDASMNDIIIGTPRVDVKVDRAGVTMDAFYLEDVVIQKMNYPCAVMAIRKEKSRKFKDENVARYVEHLWESRTSREIEVPLVSKKAS
jgi:hypothetical protein